jgi:thioredoxin-related protein
MRIFAMRAYRRCFLAFLCFIAPAYVLRAMDFADTPEAARAQEAVVAGAEPRPMFVMFSGPGCSWCRKMEVDTFPSEPVAAIAEKFLWAKVDVEEHEDLAAEFNVRGLPHLVVLDGQDRVIASQPGYLPPDRFVKFLEDALANPEPIEEVLPALTEKLLAATEVEERDALLTQIVEQLAGPARKGRQETLAAIVKVGAPAWPRLLALMSDERLAVRAAAGSALLHVTKAELPFDPFASTEARAEQTNAWQAWIKEHAVNAEIDSAPEI